MSENANDEIERSEHMSLSVGEQLKAKREEKSMSINDVASQTRITIRHLEALEKSQYGKLPGKTYIIGFSKAYARCVGLDETEIAAQLREELAETDQLNSPNFTETYEPVSASRIPPKALAWTAAIIGFIALAALLIWSNAQLNRGNDATDSEDVAEEINGDISEEIPPAEQPIPTGKVVMTATGDVWLEIYDFGRNTLFENTMKAGDTYEIPADANDPLIVTGRPDLITFTVGDNVIKPLGDGRNTIKNVRVSAKALIDYNSSSEDTAPQVPSSEINNPN